MFESTLTGSSIKIEMQRDFKRINVNRNSKQQQIDNFSIIKLDALEKHIKVHGYDEPWKAIVKNNNSFKFKMDNLTPAYCAKKLEDVEKEIKDLASLLDKEEKDLLPSEKKKVKDYDANLAELKAEKKDWNKRLDEAQKQQQGIVLLKCSESSRDCRGYGETTATTQRGYATTH